MKKENKIFVVVLLVAFFMISLWNIDVGSMLRHISYEQDANYYACNGFSCITPQQLYHIGLYGAIASMLALVYMGIKND